MGNIIRDVLWHVQCVCFYIKDNSSERTKGCKKCDKRYATSIFKGKSF